MTDTTSTEQSADPQAAAGAGVPAQAAAPGPGPGQAPAYDPPGLLERLGSAAFARVNRTREWHELPLPWGC